MTDYIEKASEEHAKTAKETMPIDDFLSFAEDNPTAVLDSISYLLEAIEHFGTRTVLESGEEKERYRFFDDPYGDGEHAILGNTDLLNEFVDELRRRASGEGENDKIIWFVGPTATGKSELKRCLINGLKGYAETEEGARYTLEWTLQNHTSDARMSYGDGNSLPKDYYKSPVNIHPLTVLPEETREAYIENIAKETYCPPRLDPFSREAMELLEENVDSFEDIIEGGFVRARRYYPEVGDGIGVLHSEDSGNSKQKLVGSWMDGAMEKFAKRGQKNPQAFSYDGVISQGNSLVSIVEDAGHHVEMLDKLLNVCEEEMVKLDNKISMDIDTLLMVFSNPDLEGTLNEYSEQWQEDPLRALRRRMDKYEFSYLNTLGIEGLLLKRELQGENFIWDGEEDRMELVAEPFTLYGAEIAPRSVEIAAMYEMLTRFGSSQTPLEPREEIILLENGRVELPEGEIVEYEDFAESTSFSSELGIPVTYTVDVLVELAQEMDVVLPTDVIQRMAGNLDDEPVFNDEEEQVFTKTVLEADSYLIDRQEQDVLEAMVGDISVTEEDVRDYIDSVLEWQEDNQSNEYDAYELKEFETRYLGCKSEDYKENAVPAAAVVEFREHIIHPISRYMWQKREEDFTVDDVPISEAPSLEPLLQENDWDTVARVFPDADLSLWENPPENTETEELKEKTVTRMEEIFGYSEESATEVSQRVVEAVDEINGVLNNGT